MASDSRRWVRWVVGSLIALVLTAVPIAGAARVSSHAGGGGPLLLATDTAVPTLDFQRDGSVSPTASSGPAYDKLISYNPYSKKFVPYLAKSWTVTPKLRPKEVVFTLRTDAKCEDGTPVTATVIKNSFERLLTVPKLADPLPKLFGAGPFHIQANDKKHTFTFRTESPYINLLWGFVDSGIICPYGLAQEAANPGWLETHQAGSGPYDLVNFVPNQLVQWKKKANWTWAPPGVNPGRMPSVMTWQTTLNVTTIANLLTTHQAQIGFLNPGPDTARLKSDSSLTTETAVGGTPLSVIFNQRPGHPGTDPTVRAALSAAISPKDVGLATWGSASTPTPSFLTPDNACFDKKVYSLAPKGDITAARKILTSAGWTPGSNGIMTKNGKPLHIDLISRIDRYAGVGEYLANQWRKIGVDVKLVDGVGTAYTSALQAANFDAGVYRAQNNRPIPWFQMNAYYGAPSPVGINYSAAGLGNNDYARAGLFLQQRTDCYWADKMQELMLTQHLILPLAWPIFAAVAVKDAVLKFQTDMQAPDPRWIQMK